MSDNEILSWLEEQKKIPPASVLILRCEVDDIDVLREKVLKIKNIIGVKILAMPTCTTGFEPARL